MKYFPNEKEDIYGTFHMMIKTHSICSFKFFFTPFLVTPEIPSTFFFQIRHCVQGRAFSMDLNGKYLLASS